MCNRLEVLGETLSLHAIQRVRIANPHIKCHVVLVGDKYALGPIIEVFPRPICDEFIGHAIHNVDDRFPNNESLFTIRT